MGPIDSPSRLAMIFRIWVRGTPWESPSKVGREDGTTEGREDAGAGPAAAAASMSRLMMRPPGPDPCTLPRLHPRSPARRRAGGEERTLSPLPPPLVPTGGAAGRAGAPTGPAGGIAAVFCCG